MLVLERDVSEKIILTPQLLSIEQDALIAACDPAIAALVKKLREPISIQLVDTRGQKARLGISASRQWLIHRSEILAEAAV